MPDTTPLLALPFPEGSDAPDGPTQIGALALAVEAELGAGLPGLAIVKRTVGGAHGASGILTYTHDEYDPDGLFDIATGIYTTPFEGIYAVNGWVQWASNSTGHRAVGIYDAGALYTRDSKLPLAGSSPYNTTDLNVFTLAIMGAGETLNLQGFQSSGGNLDYKARVSIACVRRAA